MTELTQDVLKEIIHYDPISGEWIWLYNPKSTKTRNKIYAGSKAGSITRYGYVIITFYLGGKKYQILAHRLAFLYMVGRLPTLEVDHIDMVRTNCKWDNLREVTHSENAQNRRKQSNNTTGLKGVAKCSKHPGKWYVQIVFNGKRHTKYGFTSPEEASEYYKNLVKEHHGEYGRVA